MSVLTVIVVAFLAIPAFGLIIKNLDSNSQSQKKIDSGQNLELPDSDNPDSSTNINRESEAKTSDGTKPPSRFVVEATETVAASLAPLPNISLKVPQSILVDPRAHSVFLPNVILYGEGFATVCIKSPYGDIDVAKKQSIESLLQPQNVIVTGDESNFVVVSGEVNSIENFLNSSKGISFYNERTPLMNSVLEFLVTPQRKAIIDDNSCVSSVSQSWQKIEIRPLDLTLGIVKGEIPLRAPR